MGKRNDERPHGRFGRSAHTTHHLPVEPPPPPNGTRAYEVPPPHAEPAAYREPEPRHSYPADDPARLRADQGHRPDDDRYRYRDETERYRDAPPARADRYRAAPPAHDDRYRDDRHPDDDDRYRAVDGYRAAPPGYDDRYRDEPYRDEPYRDEPYRDARYDEPDRRQPAGYREDRYRDDRYPANRYPDDRHPDDRHPDDRYRDDRYPGASAREYRDEAQREPGPRDPRDLRDPRDRHAPPPAQYPATPGPTPGDPFGSSTYHTGTVGGGQSPTVGKAAVQLGKATVSGTNKAARVVTRKVISLSEADGAKESGLTALIWNQVLSYGTDAMITVALAGTVFFGASSSAQRGNVLLYLLVTMAPFAVVAPVIGPALDRLQHGRRWTMAGTAAGRAALALVMAMHPTDLLVLYPCALGSLVLSKAYGVLRAAAAPRLVPPGMSLTAANAKLTIFGLGSTIVLGGLVGTIIKTTGSYSAGLVVTAVGFAACAFFAVKLPKQVDSAAPAPRHPDEPVRPRRQDKVPPLARIREWARRGFGAHLVIALQGQCVLRLLSGMLTIYLAFYVESTKHGLAGALELGGVVGAAGAGNFVGTAIGTRLRMAKPEAVIVISTIIAFGTLVVAAITFSIVTAIVAMLVCSALNALAKIALDSLIQNDVVETLRSSAFGKSETFLQLAWVVGAALGVALPSTSTGDGTIAFVVAAVITGAVAAVVLLRSRATQHPAAVLHAGEPAAGPRSVD